MTKSDNHRKEKGGKKKMPTQIIQVEECTCNRCGYKWIPRQTELPINCPGCRSAYWNRERVRVPSNKQNAKH